MEKPHKNYVTVEFDLPPEAEPTEWVKLTFEQTERLRWLYCKNYNDCLTYAAGQGWESFVCVFCPIWHRKRKERR